MSTVKINEADPIDDNKGVWGMFGYKGAMIDRAVARDDAAAIRRAHELGWIDPQTTTLMGDNMRTLARRKNAQKVDAALAKLGYPA